MLQLDCVSIFTVSLFFSVSLEILLLDIFSSVLKDGISLSSSTNIPIQNCNCSKIFLKKLFIYLLKTKKLLIINAIINNFVIIFLFFFYDNLFLKEKFKSKLKYPKIRKYYNFITSEECDLLIRLAKPKIKRSMVMKKNSKYSTDRTSYSTFIYRNESPLVLDIFDRLEKITKISKKNFEDIQVVKYSPGQEYKSHFDACIPVNSKMCKKDYQRGGFRLLTFLIYLNDKFEGGYTKFPLLRKKYKLAKGSGILFHNLNKSKNDHHPLSIHQGEKVISGEKWIANIWIRQSKFIE